MFCRNLGGSVFQLGSSLSSWGPGESILAESQLDLRFTKLESTPVKTLSVLFSMEHWKNRLVEEFCTVVDCVEVSVETETE